MRVKYNIGNSQSKKSQVLSMADFNQNYGKLNVNLKAQESVWLKLRLSFFYQYPP
jgi:hypothetical protein